MFQNLLYNEVLFLSSIASKRRYLQHDALD